MSRLNEILIVTDLDCAYAHEEAWDRSVAILINDAFLSWLGITNREWLSNSGAYIRVRRCADRLLVTEDSKRGLAEREYVPFELSIEREGGESLLTLRRTVVEASSLRDALVRSLSASPGETNVTTDQWDFRQKGLDDYAAAILAEAFEGTRTEISSRKAGGGNDFAVLLLDTPAAYISLAERKLKAAEALSRIYQTLPKHTY